MKRTFLATLLLILCVPFVSASIFLNGNGNLAVENFDVKAYNAIKVNWLPKIVINDTTDITPLRDKTFVEGDKFFKWEQAEKSSLSIKTDENILPYINVKVGEDSVLYLGVHEDYHIRATALEINAASPALGALTILGKFDASLLSPIYKEEFSIEMQGAGVLVADKGIYVKNGNIDMLGTGTMNISNIKVEELSAETKGKSSLSIENIDADDVKMSVFNASESVLSGKSKSFSSKIEGKGTLDAVSLVANDVNCIVTDRGKAKINAENTLKMKASGRGNIEYRGNAVIKSSENDDFARIKRGK